MFLNFLPCNWVKLYPLKKSNTSLWNKFKARYLQTLNLIIGHLGV
jgi:hypothetical protein